MNSADVAGLNNRPSTRQPDRLAQELGLLIVGGDQRCGPAVVVLDVLEQRKAAGRNCRIHGHEVVGLGRQQAHRGLRRPGVTSSETAATEPNALRSDA